ncbi:MAG: hypothetical protein QW184_00375 [Nanopusillaceae archaeon]
MKYLYLVSFFLIILAIGIYYISTEVIKPFGQAVSRALLPKKLFPNLDYVILDRNVLDNDLLLTIKFFGNISNNFCIKEIKVNNLSKNFEYFSILKDVYRIKIKNTNNYERIQIWLCDDSLIDEI